MLWTGAQCATGKDSETHSLFEQLEMLRVNHRVQVLHMGIAGYYDLFRMRATSANILPLSIYVKNTNSSCSFMFITTRGRENSGAVCTVEQCLFEVLTSHSTNVESLHSQETGGPSPASSR